MNDTKIRWENIQMPNVTVQYGLIYVACGETKQTVVEHSDNVDSLYLKALMATHHVSQNNFVVIIWGGRKWGELRGQC